MGGLVNTGFIQVDFREPSAARDCLDCLIAMPLVMEKMRMCSNPHHFTDFMFTDIQATFAELTKSNGNDLRLVGSAAQDMLYRNVAKLTILDQHTKRYVDQVVSTLFVQLACHGVRTFYILDNALREDRFKALLELFGLAGIATDTPRRDGKEWPSLRRRIRTALETNGHVAYIEPDSEVNHLDEARVLARKSVCVATFRNLAPEDSQLEVLAVDVQGFRQQSTPLFFKDADAALEYSCKFLDCSVKEGKILPALVVDSRSQFGIPAPKSVQRNGKQLAVLRVASPDGGFIVLAQTPYAKGPKLAPGEFVAWRPIKYLPEGAAMSEDKRFVWVGLIVSTLKPEWRADGGWVAGQSYEP